MMVHEAQAGRLATPARGLQAGASSIFSGSGYKIAASRPQQAPGDALASLGAGTYEWTSACAMNITAFRRPGHAPDQSREGVTGPKDYVP